MSDLISRSALIKAMEKKYEVAYKTGLNAVGLDCGFIVTEKIIQEQPTVEAKSVIYCKDCEHWGTGVVGETEHVKCCEYGKYMVGANGYCCYADMRKKVE